MDRDFLIDLFSALGPVTVRRMFSGYGISVDGVTFSLVLRGTVHLRADDTTIPAFEAEGSRPFSYQRPGRVVTVASYWTLPERLYDDPDELAQWARNAIAAAGRAQARKRVRKPRKAAADKPVGRARVAAKGKKASNSVKAVKAVPKRAAKKKMRKIAR